MGAAGEDVLQVLSHQLLRDLRFGQIRLNGGQPLADGLDHERHHQEDLRFHHADVPDHVQQGVIDIERGAEGEALEPVHDQTVGVVYGQYGEHRCSGFKSDDYVGHVVIQVPLGQHDALALSGGTGGKDNGTDVI